MKGYKAFDKDLKCRGFQFKVGKTYKINGDLLLCKNGFHFCAKFFDVFVYYDKNINTRICEIEAIGKVLTEDDKSATSEIKIIKELSHSEILALFMSNTNSGNGNSGYGNSGNRNSGNRNSGNGNSGDGNSGYGNSGYGNSGNRNSGDWNSGNGNSGYFNTEIPLYFFNKPSTTKYTKELESKIRNINVKPILTYVYANEMTDKEKEENPSHKVTGGFLRKTNRHNWTFLTEKDKEFIKSLPNYNDEIFKVISNGVSLEEPKTIKVTVEGKEFEIDIQKAKELGLLK